MKHHPRIEFLESTHIDKGTEQLPQIPTWQHRAVRLVFQILGPVFPKRLSYFAYKIFASPRWRAKHRKPDALILAAQVVDFQLDKEIVKVYEWDTEGSKNDSKKPLILLVHGWESRGTALRMYVKPLLEKGFKVIAFDALAHGDSTGTRNNLATNGRTIAALTAHYGGFYGAIGHSFGCSSIVYAQAFVDNSIAIERLVFLAVPHRTRQIMEHFFGFIGTPKAVNAAFLKHVAATTGLSVDKMDVAQLSPPSVKVGKLLLIHDQKDEVTTIDAAERVVETWENALLLVTNGYGHFRIAKNPDVIRRIVAFIVS